MRIEVGKDTEDFLKAEESVNNLINTLEKLQNEVNSYQDATNEIALARDKLIELIDSVKDISKGSYEVVKLLKEIGGPEILERIGKVENELFNSTRNIDINLNEKLIKLENKLEEITKKQFSYLKKFQILIIILLIISMATITFLIEPRYILELKNLLLYLNQSG